LCAVRVLPYFSNFAFSLRFLTETHLVAGSKLWNLLRGNAERRTAAIGLNGERLAIGCF